MRQGGIQGERDGVAEAGGGGVLRRISPCVGMMWLLCGQQIMEWGQRGGGVKEGWVHGMNVNPKKWTLLMTACICVWEGGGRKRGDGGS